MGYSRAGFTDIVGVDIVAQPHYPFAFVQADAFEYLAAHWQEFDAFHASPVCKGYTVMHNLPWLRDKVYPLQILPIREAFQAIGKPYVIENVMGARWGAKGLVKRGLQSHGMQAGWLCGLMFGLPLYRHRLFETNWAWLAPGHPKHQYRIRSGHSLAGRARDIVFSDAEDARGKASWPGQRGQAAGSGLTMWQENHGSSKPMSHTKGWGLAAEAMGVEWMDQEGMTQAIPPVYTEFLGGYLLREIAMRNGGKGEGS